MIEIEGLPSAQRMALTALVSADRALTAHELGERLRWDTAYAAAVLRELAARDLLEISEARSVRGPSRKAFGIKAESGMPASTGVPGLGQIAQGVM